MFGDKPIKRFYILWSVHGNHVGFTVHDDLNNVQHTSGSNPIYPGENADITKGRILQSLGILTPDDYGPTIINGDQK